MIINVKYFAAIRDYAGIEEERLDTQAENARELYSFLKDKYSFTLNESDLRVAINKSFTSFNTSLKNNDVVAFIPPVSGG